MEILLGIAIVGLVAQAILLVRMNQKQIEMLNDRLAAKSIEEYKYYKEVYPKEVKAEEQKQKVKAKELRKTYSPDEDFRRKIGAIS